MNLTIWFNFYIFIMLMSMSSSTWMSMWTILEISSWLIIILMMSDIMSSDSLFKMYFLFSLISVMLVFCWMIFKFKQEWLLILFSLKMAIPPCHWWLGWILKNIKWKLMWWFSTLHKFIPMIFSIIVISSNILVYWVILSTFWSAISTVNSSSVFNIIFFSSCMHTSWIWMTTMWFFMFLFYFLMYVFMMWWVFKYIDNWTFFNKSHMFKIYIILLMGFPPSLLFFNKMIVSSLISINSLLVMWLILLTNVFMIIPYSRMIWMSSLNNLFNYMQIKDNNTNQNLLLYMMIIFQFFYWPLII